MKRIGLLLGSFCVVLALATPYPLYDLVQLHQDSDCIFVFCHGFLANRKHAYYYLDHSVMYPGTIPHSLVTFDFAEADTAWQLPEREDVNFGQELDVEQLDRVVRAIRGRFPQKRIVLYGVSRGASAIINYLALKGNEAVYDIAAAVLESPFDHVMSVVRNILAKVYLHKIPGMLALGRFILLRLAPAYSDKGPHPIEQIQNISSKIPLLFIASAEDGLIYPGDTQVLIDAIRLAGHPAISALCTPSGEHGNILWSDSGFLYLVTVREFYQSHGII